MYVRFATFDGGDGNWDERSALIGDIVRSGQGTPMEAASNAIKRMLLVDRETNRGANGG